MQPFSCLFRAQEFFLTVKDILRNQPSSGPEAFRKWEKEDLELSETWVKRIELLSFSLCSLTNESSFLH